jgi:serine/threonine-protein kinase ULK/ATG1
MIKRNNMRKDEIPNIKESEAKTASTDDKGDDKIDDKITERELEIKSFKRNANRLLHYRNIYVFLASSAE